MTQHSSSSRPQPKRIENITAGNVALRDQYIVVDGQEIRLPKHDELLNYLHKVRSDHARWADRPDDSEPLFQQSDDPMTGPDAFVPLDAKPLPMRVAEFRSQPGGEEPPSQELLDAVGKSQRTVILGEPGSGKTTALERIAWVTAEYSLSLSANGNDEPLTLPIFARLADYQGESDLLPLLRRTLSRGGLVLDTDLSLRATLHASDVHFVLLLDGLNELRRDHAEEGLASIGRHLDEFDEHTVHLTCRTADFDQPQAGTALPDETQLWTVQPLTDDIRYWDDTEGESDVRQYLREHLGADQGKRLYERLRADDRLRSMALLPLFLWMFKETAGSSDGILPTNRGELVQSFVHSDRIWAHVPKDLRSRGQRGLEELAWAMQDVGRLETDEDALYTVLEEVRGRRSYELDTMRQYMQRTGLLVSLGDERWRMLHQIVQETGAAAHLARHPDCEQQLPALAHEEWHRECCILTLWLAADLQRSGYLLGLMGDPAVDLRVRVAAAEVLTEVGDPRLAVSHSVDGIKYIEPDMVPIPAGEAVLGGEDPEAYDDELPQCTVSVAAFEIARYPVTNAEFRCFVEAGGYDDESLWTEDGRAWLRGEAKLDPETEQQWRSLYQILRSDVEGFIEQMREGSALSDEQADQWRQAATLSEDDFLQAITGSTREVRREPYFWHDNRYNGANQPIVGINWYEAMAYAAWLEKVTGKGYRLLTEAEWEWAARRNARRYPWGNDWEPNRCNWSDSRLNRGSPVGVYPHGVTPDDNIHDLGGNVDEWTTSLYRPYPYMPDDGREDPEAEGLRVLRGGSWYGEGRWVRCAYRYRLDTTFDDHCNGMRLARTLSQ